MNVNLTLLHYDNQVRLPLVLKLHCSDKPSTKCRSMHFQLTKKPFSLIPAQFCIITSIHGNRRVQKWPKNFREKLNIRFLLLRQRQDRIYVRPFQLKFQSESSSERREQERKKGNSRSSTCNCYTKERATIVAKSSSSNGTFYYTKYSK